LQRAARFLACCPDGILRNGSRALELIRQVAETSESPQWHVESIFAAAYAEMGDFAAAVQHAEQALELAPEAEKPERAERLALYRAGQPYRFPRPAASSTAAPD
jgi:hypothetical protein